MMGSSKKNSRGSATTPIKQLMDRRGDSESVEESKNLSLMTSIESEASEQRAAPTEPFRHRWQKKNNGRAGKKANDGEDDEDEDGDFSDRQERKSSKAGSFHPNGRVKGRKLVMWHRPRMMEKLMLHTWYECHRAGVKIPWNKIVTRLSPGSSGLAAVQHFAKMRDILITEGHMVPPLLGKQSQAQDPSIRGFVRDMDSSCPTDTKVLSWNEDYEDKKESLTVDGLIRGSGNYKRLNPTASKTPSSAAGVKRRYSNRVKVEETDDDEEEPIKPSPKRRAKPTARATRPKPVKFVRDLSRSASPDLVGLASDEEYTPNGKNKTRRNATTFRKFQGLDSASESSDVGSDNDDDDGSYLQSNGSEKPSLIVKLPLGRENCQIFENACYEAEIAAKPDMQIQGMLQEELESASEQSREVTPEDDESYPASEQSEPDSGESLITPRGNHQSGGYMSQTKDQYAMGQVYMQTPAESGLVPIAPQSSVHYSPTVSHVNQGFYQQDAIVDQNINDFGMNLDMFDCSILDGFASSNDLPLNSMTYGNRNLFPAKSQADATRGVQSYEPIRRLSNTSLGGSVGGSFESTSTFSSEKAFKGVDRATKATFRPFEPFQDADDNIDPFHQQPYSSAFADQFWY